MFVRRGLAPGKLFSHSSLCKPDTTSCWFAYEVKFYTERITLRMRTVWHGCHAACILIAPVWASNRICTARREEWSYGFVKSSQHAVRRTRVPCWSQKDELWLATKLYFRSPCCSGRQEYVSGTTLHVTIRDVTRRKTAPGISMRVMRDVSWRIGGLFLSVSVRSQSNGDTSEGYL